MNFRVAGIFFEDFLIYGNGHGPLFLAAEEFTHDKARFRAATSLESGIQLFGRFLILITAHQFSGHREALKKFEGFLIFRVGQIDAGCFGEGGENSGVSAGGGELSAQLVRGTKCQTA